MIQIKNLSKHYQNADSSLAALSDVNITVQDGEILGIIGMSGAGKSTLVRCINLLERPTSGQVLMDGVDLGTLSPGALRHTRRNIAMIFQSFNLLMQRSCLGNVCFPLELAGVKKADAEARALELLELVGLRDKAYAYPAQLSGGQKQRVAIARALATDPKVLLCDEATSALDPSTTRSILELIRHINRTLGITVIIITHQMHVVEEICHRVAILDEGRVAEQGAVSQVFSDPQSAAARRLFFPEEDASTVIPAAEGEQFIRVFFAGARTTGSPMIARMAMDKGIAANIAFASTRRVGLQVYGSMLLGISGGPEKVREAIGYLTSMAGITAREVELHV